LQFRAEGFNLFNRAQYGAPLANIYAPSTFGRIAILIITARRALVRRVSSVRVAIDVLKEIFALLKAPVF
jgi:hypothetical protein